MAIGLIAERCPAGAAAPSANRFGKVSPTSAAHVRDDSGGNDVGVVLDGGVCRRDRVDHRRRNRSGAGLLRGRRTSRARVEETIGRRCAMVTTGDVAVPGTLASHYAPKATVQIVDADAVARRRSRAHRPRGAGRACSHSQDLPGRTERAARLELRHAERASTGMAPGTPTSRVTRSWPPRCWRPTGSGAAAADRAEVCRGLKTTLQDRPAPASARSQMPLDERPIGVFHSGLGGLHRRARLLLDLVPDEQQ